MLERPSVRSRPWPCCGAVIAEELASAALLMRWNWLSSRYPAPANVVSLVGDEHFESSDVSEHHNHDLPEGSAGRRSRARNLIKLSGSGARISKQA